MAAMANGNGNTAPSAPMPTDEPSAPPMAPVETYQSKECVICLENKASVLNLSGLVHHGALWEKMPHFFVIFVEKGNFSDLLLCPITRVSIHNLSFEPNLIKNIFNYLVLKTVRQNSLICPLKSHKNRQNSDFCWTFLDSRYLNLLIKYDKI